MRFQVPDQVEADGMQVPAGAYSGTLKALGVTYMGRIQWQPPQYWLVLPESAAGSPFLSAEVEVTSHVANGSVIVL